MPAVQSCMPLPPTAHTCRCLHDSCVAIAIRLDQLRALVLERQPAVIDRLEQLLEQVQTADPLWRTPLSLLLLHPLPLPPPPTHSSAVIIWWRFLRMIAVTAPLLATGCGTAAGGRGELCLPGSRKHADCIRRCRTCCGIIANGNPVTVLSTPPSTCPSTMTALLWPRRSRCSPNTSQVGKRRQRQAMASNGLGCRPGCCWPLRWKRRPVGAGR